MSKARRTRKSKRLHKAPEDDVLSVRLTKLEGLFESLIDDSHTASRRLAVLRQEILTVRATLAAIRGAD